MYIVLYFIFVILLLYESYENNERGSVQRNLVKV